MSDSLFLFGKLSIPKLKDWENITQVLKKDAPFSITKANGAGAIQVSFAKHAAGEAPDVTVDDLDDFLLDFEVNRGFYQKSDEVIADGKIKSVGASFKFKDDFVRAWYLSNGQDVALVTYLCAWDDQEEEIDEVNKIVGEISFN